MSENTPPENPAQPNENESFKVSISPPDDTESKKQNILKSNRKRNKLSFEQKMEIVRHMKRYLLAGLTFYEMKDELRKQGYDLSIGLIFKLHTLAQEQIFSTQEFTRIVLERIEKKRYVERQAMQIVGEINKKDESGNYIYPPKDRMYVLKSFMEIQKDVDDFLSRFNILSAVPVRQEVEIKPKIDTDQLIEILQKNE